MEGVRVVSDQSLWSRIFGYAKRGVNFVRQKTVKGLNRIFGYAKRGVNFVRQKTVKGLNRIFGYAKRGVNFVRQQTVKCLSRIKAFFSNLSEKLRECLARARRKLEDKWNCIKELAVRTFCAVNKKFCADKPSQLLHQCVCFSEAALLIFIKRRSEAIHKIIRVLKLLYRLPSEYHWVVNERTLLVKLVKYLLTKLESCFTGTKQVLVRLLKLIVEIFGDRFVGENGSVFTARFHFARSFAM